jgi:hypothetical protein
LPTGAKLAANYYKIIRQESKFEDEKTGVIFLVAAHLATAVMKESCAVPNQLWIRITGTGGKRDLFVCSAYMPQETALKAERETAFCALHASAKAFGDQGDVAVLGDLNAKLSSSPPQRGGLQSLSGPTGNRALPLVTVP